MSDWIEIHDRQPRSETTKFRVKDATERETLAYWDALREEFFLDTPEAPTFNATHWQEMQ